MPSLEQLPNEIQDAVYSHCTKSELCNIRLASKTLALAGARRLFNHITVCCLAFSLQNLSCIAQSDYRSHVRHLTLIPSSLTDSKVVLNCIDTVLQFSKMGDDFRRMGVISEVRPAYEMLLLQQMLFKESAGRLAAMFASFKHLQHLSILSPEAQDDYEHWDSSRPSLALLRQLMPLNMGSSSKGFDFSPALAALPCEALQTLTIDLERDQQAGYACSLFTSPARECTIPRLAQLKRLHLAICTSDKAQVTDAMVMLKQSPALQYLCFRAQPAGSRFPYRTERHLSATLAEAHWPDLIELHLDVAVLEDHLLTCLHKHGVRILSLEHMWLENIRNVLEQISKLGLEQVRIRGLQQSMVIGQQHVLQDFFEQGLSDAQAQWLLSGQGDMPKIS